MKFEFIKVGELIEKYGFVPYVCAVQDFCRVTVSNPMSKLVYTFYLKGGTPFEKAMNDVLDMLVIYEKV